MKFKFASSSNAYDAARMFLCHQALTTLSGLAAIEDMDNLKVSTSAWSWLYLVAAFLRVMSCPVVKFFTRADDFFVLGVSKASDHCAWLPHPRPGIVVR